MTARATLALLLLVIGVLRAGAVEQPVKFNHKKHTQDNGLDCSTCHPTYGERAGAGRPGVEVCSMCHSESLGDSPEAEKVHGYVERGDEIPWLRLYRMPDHVRYSHARHVTVGGVECSTCHGQIGETTEPPRQPLVEITMELCVECHRQVDVSTDCIFCHR